MPYKIRKMPNRACYRVSNAKTGRVYANCTSRENAKKQVSLLRSIERKKSKAIGRVYHPALERKRAKRHH